MTVMYNLKRPGEPTVKIIRPEPSSYKHHVESPTGDLDDIVSCYIHSPVSESVLKSPDDTPLGIPQGSQVTTWKPHISKQNLSKSTPSVSLKQGQGTSLHCKRPIVDDTEMDDGFSSPEEFPSRSLDPLKGTNPYFGDTEDSPLRHAPDSISFSVGLLRKKSQNRGKGPHTKVTGM